MNDPFEIAPSLGCCGYRPTDRSGVLGV